MLLWHGADGQRCLLQLKPDPLGGSSKAMRGTWQSPLQLSAIGERGDSDLATRSGIYVVSTTRPLNRVLASDPAGILYIGKASNLRSRLRSFLYGSHGATGFLWTYPAIRRAVLCASSESEPDCQSALESGFVRCAFVAQVSLSRAEQIALFAYYQQFGEFPPLNSSMPNRWNPPTSAQLLWAAPAFEPTDLNRL